MFWRRRTRLDEEIDAHLAAETAENLERGMDASEARNAALRTFGNVEAAKERARELDPLYWLDTLWQDTRFALRMIGRNRWISLTIIATLTVGIALNVSVFSLLNRLLLRPWVEKSPETFVSLIPRYSGEFKLRYSSGGISQPDYTLYRDSAKSVESLAAFRAMAVTLGGEHAARIRSGLISCNLFDVVRTGPPIAGRYFEPDECAKPLEGAVAVLTEEAWRARFNSDRNVVGRVIQLNRMPFTVIGVAPSFMLPGLGNERDVWIPYTMLGRLQPADEYFADPRAHWLTLVGRRRAQYSQRQAQEEITLLARRADELVPGRVTTMLVTDGSPVQEPEMRSRAPLVFGITLGTTALLLLLACVNVTTLMLSRATARQHEIAVRLSLGAGRFRLLRQLLTESLVLSGIASAISLLIAQRAPAAIWNSLMSSRAAFDFGPDWRTLIYCLGVAAAVGVIAGLSPAWESLRPRVSESLKGSGGAVTTGQRRSLLRNSLVAAQVALSLILLVEAALFTRAQRQFFGHDPGFETKQVLTVTLASVLSGFTPPTHFYEELEDRIGGLPGVVNTSAVSIAPWQGRNSTELSEIDGKPLARTRDFRQDPARRVVSSEFFETLGIPIHQGRGFTTAEALRQGEVVPVVVSEAMARRYWPGQSALGHRFRTGVVHEVVGVCRDVQSVGHMQNDGPFYYAPLDPQRVKPAFLMVRFSGDPGTAAAAVRSVVRQLDPQMAVGVETLAAVLEEQGERLKPVVMYGGMAGGLALLLALSGVYAVVSYSVSQRVREIGIRMALGAGRGEIVRFVLRAGVAPVVGGLVAGVGLALAASAVMQSVLFGLNPRDPVTFTVVPVVLLLASLGAIWIPARRASVLDPVRSLRQE